MNETRNNFLNYLKENLNDAQYNAATSKDGSILIVAGAGSGKTRIITSRIAYLILQENVNPSSIIALTFTNKAAHEMKERIQQFLNRDSHLPFVGTFHSYALRMLKLHADLIDHPFISILDEEDQQKILQSILNKSNLHKKVSTKQIAYQISCIKNQMIQADDFHINPLIHEIYRLYELEKRASKCLDFDDLLLELVNLFSKNSDFKKNFQEKINHILVDEYQDTNIVQHELLKQMALDTQKKSLKIHSVCAVGDEDQSIYSWRGATVYNIMNFSGDFKNTKIVKIEQNYRSAQSILRLANTVIEQNKNRNPKRLWSEKKGADRTRLITFLSEYQEADAIAQGVKQLRAQSKEVAILYRTHFQSRAIEEALLKHVIPYKIIGGIQFYERKEIKDILAYLRLVTNPFDRVSFFRVINCPLRGLGNKFEELFQQHWDTTLFASFFDIARQLIDNKIITGIKKEALQDFIQLFQSIELNIKPSKAVEYFINKTSYFNYLKESYDQEEALGKIENLKELIQAIKHIETQRSLTISEFLDEVALMQSQMHNDQQEANPVLLMTLHAAKGLEFNTVIVTGLEEGLLPNSRSLADSQAIEEERRLFYVGITRAQEYLLISNTRYRYHFGTMTDQRPSQFLKEIGNEILPAYDATYWQTNQINDFFSSWFLRKPFKEKDQPSKIINDSGIEKITKLVGWKVNQPVIHKSFGTGIIKAVERRANGSTFLQVQFKQGLKKIDAQFITLI